VLNLFGNLVLFTVLTYIQRDSSHQPSIPALYSLFWIDRGSLKTKMMSLHLALSV